MKLKVNPGFCPIKSNNTKVEVHYDDAEGTVVDGTHWVNENLWVIRVEDIGYNITHYRILTPETEYVQ